MLWAELAAEDESMGVGESAFPDGTPAATATPAARAAVFLRKTRLLVMGLPLLVRIGDCRFRHFSCQD
jgi:hypothetical protein